MVPWTSPAVHLGGIEWEVVVYRGRHVTTTAQHPTGADGSGLDADAAADVALLIDDHDIGDLSSDEEPAGARDRSLSSSSFAPSSSDDESAQQGVTVWYSLYVGKGGGGAGGVGGLWLGHPPHENQR